MWGGLSGPLVRGRVGRIKCVRQKKPNPLPTLPPSQPQAITTAMEWIGGRGFCSALFRFYF